MGVINNIIVVRTPTDCPTSRIYVPSDASIQEAPTVNRIKGETVGIIGRNGSGKSTLLQLICGTLTPTAGTVEVNGKVAALLELGAGFNPDFTGRENIILNASIMGLARKKIDEKFDSIISFADIGDFIDQPVKSYSSGMYVRLAFAIVAHLDADILIIDEALAVGDAFFTQKCMRFLREFRKHGTILFVSHDTESVLSLCHRAIWLEHGEIQKIGTAKDVAEAYLEAFFEANQGASNISQNKQSSSNKNESELPLKDQRLQFINQSNLRNDLEIFSFDPDRAGFGKGEARIIDVKLTDDQNIPLSWIVGGEIVKLHIAVEVYNNLKSIIVGFYIKNNLGQMLFGDNTYLTYASEPINTAPNEVVEAVFSFQMPILPAGNYSITAAVASGTGEEHIQHHWIHDALIFKSHTSHVSSGLVGIPMQNISMVVKSTQLSSLLRHE